MAVGSEFDSIFSKAPNKRLVFHVSCKLSEELSSVQTDISFARRLEDCMVVPNMASIVSSNPSMLQIERAHSFSKPRT